MFGKCNNPNWHGHNYTLDVSVTGPVDERTGYVIDLGVLKQIVEREVVDKADHKNFNLEVDFMRGHHSDDGEHHRRDVARARAGDRAGAAHAPRALGDAEQLRRVRRQVSTPRLAVVTGASRGIGLAVAQRLLDDEMRVVMIARRRGRAARRRRAVRRSRGADRMRRRRSARDRRDGRARARRARRAPDVVVNNAGLFKLVAAHATDPTDFADALDVNLVAPFRVIRAFLRRCASARAGTS